MTVVETKFRKIITKFGQMPWLFLLLWLILYQGVTYTQEPIFALYTMMQALVSPEVFEGIVIYQVSPLTIRLLLCRSLFLSYFFWSIIKYLYRKPRPVKVVAKTFLQRLDASSFPSIHTSNSFIVAFYGVFMLLFSAMETSPIYNIILAVVLFLYFVSVSLSRIALQKHYPIDVLWWVIFWIMIIWLTSFLEQYILAIAAFIFWIII